MGSCCCASELPPRLALTSGRFAAYALGAKVAIMDRSEKECSADVVGTLKHNDGGEPGSCSASCCTFNSKGSALAVTFDSATSGSVLIIFDVASGTKQDGGEVLLEGTKGKHCTALLFSPDDSKIFVATAGCGVFVCCKLSSSKQKLTVASQLSAGSPSVAAIAVSRDGASLAAARDNGEVTIFDAATGSARGLLRNAAGTTALCADGGNGDDAGSSPAAACTSICFTPEGSSIVVGSSSGRLFVHPMSSTGGGGSASFEIHNAAITSVVPSPVQPPPSPSGSGAARSILLATCSRDERAAFVIASTSEQIMTIRTAMCSRARDAEAAIAVRFLPPIPSSASAPAFAAGASAGSASFRADAQLNAPTIVVAEDGQDGLLRLFQYQSGADSSAVPLGVVAVGHRVNGLCVSSDGMSCAAACADGAVRLLVVKRGKELVVVDAPDGANVTGLEWQDGGTTCVFKTAGGGERGGLVDMRTISGGLSGGRQPGVSQQQQPRFLDADMK